MLSQGPVVPVRGRGKSRVTLEQKTFRLGRPLQGCETQTQQTLRSRGATISRAELLQPQGYRFTQQGLGLSCPSLVYHHSREPQECPRDIDVPGRK
jgi:hypothetical protein